MTQSHRGGAGPASPCGLPPSRDTHRVSEGKSSVYYRQHQSARRDDFAVEVVNIRPVVNAGNLRALATVRIGPITLPGFRVIQQPGQRAWVSAPQEKGADGKWYPRLEITDRSLEGQVKAAVLQAWEETNERR